ncbi:hypothetical protein DFH09DRAFT_1367523 [Mycena vulgaris]|nr:hypothetical protein DFH09DRAFT_1367523 [Mycena vulgaris]
MRRRRRSPPPAPTPRHLHLRCPATTRCRDAAAATSRCDATTPQYPLRRSEAATSRLAASAAPRRLAADASPSAQRRPATPHRHRRLTPRLNAATRRRSAATRPPRRGDVETSLPSRRHLDAAQQHLNAHTSHRSNAATQTQLRLAPRSVSTPESDFPPAPAAPPRRSASTTPRPADAPQKRRRKTTSAPPPSFFFLSPSLSFQTPSHYPLRGFRFSKHSSVSRAMAER